MNQPFNDYEEHNLNNSDNLPDDDKGGNETDNNGFYEGDLIAKFPVDLSREEFVEFNVAVNKVKNSRSREVSFKGNIFYIVIFVFFTGLFFYDFYISRKIDFIYLSLIVFYVAAFIFSKLISPVVVSKTSQRNYDQSVLGGHTYYGNVSVYRDKIVKESKSGKVELFYREDIYYIENPKCIIVMVTGKPAIVLPARCMTKEDISLTKRVLLSAIHPTKQFLTGEVVSSTEHHISSPAEMDGEQWDMEDVYRISVAYSKSELVSSSFDGVIRGYIKKLPVFLSLGLVGLALGIIFKELLLGIVFFLFMVTGILVVQLLVAYFRSISLARRMEDEEEFIVFEFNPLGIILKGSWSEDDRVGGVVWDAVEKATQGEKKVEFFSDTGVLTIPRRFITDFEKLEQIVDRYYSKKKKS